MFDVGFTELLVIGAVALIVLGPEQLPGVMLKLGRLVGTAKRQMQKWQAELEDTALDQEIAEHNKRITEQTKSHPGEGRDPENISEDSLAKLDPGLRRDDK